MESTSLNGATTVGSGGNGLPGSGDSILGRIQEALNTVHTSHSTNQSRQEAQVFLESVRDLPEAPSHGFTLASDKSHSPILRHYGLSLLEHAIRHRWSEYSPEQAQYLREWVLQLAQAVSKPDPQYIRSKIAQLWAEVAARCWAAEWLDMDELLVRMWEVPDSPIHKELVLQILETLSEQVFNAEDTVVAMRSGELSRACVEIFTPAGVLAEAFPNRQAGPAVRFGDDGWLQRVGVFLDGCLKGDIQSDQDVQSCTLRALAVFYSVMPWAIPKAIAATRCVQYMCTGLASPVVSIQRAALEALHALYSRHHFTDDEFLQLVVPMYNSEFVGLCVRLFEWSSVDAQDIDDDKYQFSKKFSEMLSCLGNYLDRKYFALPRDTNIQDFLQLLLLVAQSQSLVVSIPVLVTWTRLLRNAAIGPIVATTHIVAPLLELCSSRLIRYESLPEDTEDPTYLLLLEDTDTTPERHAFLGNYRRYSCQVIESIVELKLADATYHILTTAEKMLSTLYVTGPALDVTKYSKNSLAVLTVDAHFTVIESALRGYMKWRSTDAESSDRKQQEAFSLEAQFEGWCNRLLDFKVEDPLIRKRILQLLVAFSTTALDKNAGFMLKVLEHILMTWPSPRPEHRLFNDAIKDLQSESMVELQRLASKMPDHLLDVYDQLEAKIKELIASGTLDEKRQIAYRSFLFIIIHRATRIDTGTRVARLLAFVDPVKSQWMDEGLKRALASSDGFFELLGLDKAQSYLTRRRVHEIGDWGSVELDAEGLELQNQLEERLTHLPLRSTKSFLTYSVERLEKNSPPYQASCLIWKDAFPLILPELLNFISHAHGAHNPAHWSLLPAEMHCIVGRVLTDRFWQAGISEGSRDEFYARVLDKKNTLEGLASSIRGSVRFVRETCHSILYCMSKLDMYFYGFPELPGPLAQALFADSVNLSSHQTIGLLNLVRYLVDNCPVVLREHFLPPILAASFQQMDRKITSEWDTLEKRQGVKAAGDELTEEMKAESILRQLTYTAVLMVSDFLDPSRPDPPINATVYGYAVQQSSDSRHPSLRRFCLMTSSIVEPLLLFCTHAIRMHDTRCCSTVLHVFRSIVPEFQGHLETHQQKPDLTTDAARISLQNENFPVPEETASAIREFIASDVLKACITSLHDPYFVDSQRDLGSLIASILVHYCPVSSTPRNILTTLPNIKPHDVDQTINYMLQPGLHPRQQRALVLDLLKDLKGVSIAEMGKLNRATRPRRVHRSKMAQEFMTAPPTTAGVVAPGAAENRGSPDLEGVAGMFNEGS
ncbi:hypothetical protein VTK73DRAFT_4368 [Phialemonium thermophilum]|uniref:Importin N-terminal domain-containing protein n=1 Tax=Phialemonium thermophilum TaxID=223376 RepID=A0ABR3XZB8_9PEZI